MNDAHLSCIPSLKDIFTNKLIIGIDLFQSIKLRIFSITAKYLYCKFNPI